MTADLEPTSDFLLSDEAPKLRARDLLVWDGSCPLCRRSVEWVKARDPKDRFLAIPYQSVPEPLVGREIKQAAAHTVHVLRTDGTVLKSGRAVLYILETLGYRWVRPFEKPPLVWLVELGYHAVSTNRHLLSRWLFRARDAS